MMPYFATTLIALIMAPAHGFSLASSVRSARIANRANRISMGPEVTNKVFFDVSIGGKPAG